MEEDNQLKKVFHFESWKFQLCVLGLTFQKCIPRYLKESSILTGAGSSPLITSLGIDMTWNMINLPQMYVGNIFEKLIVPCFPAENPL